jgi:hypothetical protein
MKQYTLTAEQNLKEAVNYLDDMRVLVCKEGNQQYEPMLHSAMMKIFIAMDNLPSNESTPSPSKQEPQQEQVMSGDGERFFRAWDKKMGYWWSGSNININPYGEVFYKEGNSEWKLDGNGRFLIQFQEATPAPQQEVWIKANEKLPEYFMPVSVRINGWKDKKYETRLEGINPKYFEINGERFYERNFCNVEWLSSLTHPAPQQRITKKGRGSTGRQGRRR